MLCSMIELVCKLSLGFSLFFSFFFGYGLMDWL